MTVSESARARRGSTRKAGSLVYWIVIWVCARLMRLVYRYELSGLENLPSTGPTVIVVNHLHLLDPIAVTPVIRRKVVALAADKWRRNPKTRWLLRMADAIFIRRGEVDRHALRSCLEVLGQGGVLGVAAEGTRSETGSLQRGKPGVAYLATRTNATIVPMAIWGTERLGDWARLRRPTCRVVIGRPFRLPQSSRRLTTEELQELTDQIMIRLGSLLPERYRGVYAERIAAIEAEEAAGLPG